MSNLDMESIKARAGKLNSSPLFRLSLASNELFHSNFIHWLLMDTKGQIKQEARELFCALLGIRGYTIEDGQREKNHNDLVLILKDISGKKTRKVIIENKVKSWRDLDQLGEYSEKARGKDELTPLFVLLSLTIPPEARKSDKIVDSKNGTWLFLSYKRLNAGFITPLQEKAAGIKETYLAALLDDYASMIDDMTKLLEEDLFPKGKAAKPLGKLTPAGIEEVSDLLGKECRLNAIFEKSLFARFEDMAAGIMLEKGAVAPNRYRGKDDRKVPEACFNISSGYSNLGHKAYLNLVYRCPKGVVIGVQIEGSQYRHFISHIEGEESVENYVDSYFDPKGVDAGSMYGIPGAPSGMKFKKPSQKSTYGKYCSFVGTHFLYLHAPIKDMPMSAVLEMAVEDILLQAKKANGLKPRRTRMVPQKGRGN